MLWLEFLNYKKGNENYYFPGTAIQVLYFWYLNYLNSIINSLKCAPDQ